MPSASLTVFAGINDTWVGKNFGIDNDAAILDPKKVSSAPYIKNMWINQGLSLSCAIFPWPGKDNCSNNRDILADLYKQSALGNINSAISVLYKYPPADLAYWVRDTAATMGFAPRQVMAQGIGFNGLTALLPIWKAFRNMAYVLLALAMIVVGFMVMLRKKIDPKTVVTVQNALPRIVIALILITFSYAIVGLFIDVMYLVIAFINVIVNTGLPNKYPNSPNLTSGEFGDLINGVFSPLTNTFAQIDTDLVRGDTAGVLTEAAEATQLNLDIGFLFQLIVGLGYLFALVRILFMLLGAYTQILLAVLIGPLQILIDVFPGANGFTNWIKNIIANLSVFPVTIFLLLLGGRIGLYLGGGKLWVPPLLPPGVNWISEVLISLGIVLMIPSICHSIKEAFKTKPLVGGSAGGGIMGGMGSLSSIYYAQAITPSFIKKRITGMLGMGEGGGGGEADH